MKVKLILAIVVLSFVCPIFGQSGTPKRVAILETVDKESSVSYGIKLMIRSKLGAAINNTSGYEAYDRVDIASIMNEQEFQRTGLVDAAQIKKLGEMTGVNYILVVEAANIDAENVAIIAKILDVESAKIEQTANLHSSIDINRMDESCRTLAERLLKINLKTGASTGELRMGDDIYMGEYIDGKPHGSGKMVFAKTDIRKSYTGQWKNGDFDGEGILLYKNGDSYSGEFKDGMPHGIGKYMDAEGTYYQGSWEHGMRSGQGQLYANQKLVFAGCWSKGRAHGEGTAIYGNGDLEEAIYVEGEKQGQATYYFASGACERGVYVDSQKSGQWNCYDVKGNLIAIKIYKRGKLIINKVIDKNKKNK